MVIEDSSVLLVIDVVGNNVGFVMALVEFIGPFVVMELLCKWFKNYCGGQQLAG